MDKEIRLSVSKCKCFAQCKKQFKFNYIDKLPKIDKPYLIFGTVCHKILEDFHNIYINGCQEPKNKVMSTVYKSTIKEYKEKLTPEMNKECFDIINSYLKLISDPKEILAKPVLACEKLFNLTLPGAQIILNGAIDRIQIDDDGILHVADYKTTKNKKYLEGDWFQLLTYAYVLCCEDPTLTKVRASYVLLKHGFECLSIEFPIKEIISIKDKFIKYAEQIQNETEFPATTSFLCAYCDFLNLCEEGKKKVNPSLTYGEVSW
jgi:putative RecB family exonuclease